MPRQGALTDELRSEIPALMEARAEILQDKASALPLVNFCFLIVSWIWGLCAFCTGVIAQ